MEWIDLALLESEVVLSAHLSSLSGKDRHVIRDELFEMLGIDADEFDLSTLRILIERARAFALPTGLWARAADSSLSIQDAGAAHLAALGISSNPQRLAAMQSMYHQFIVGRSRRTKVTLKKLESCGYRCELCGLRFCNEDLESRGWESPHGYRQKILPDPFKPHWSDPNLRTPTLDHDWPVSTYGSNALTNQKILCSGCNGGKANFVALEQTGAWTGMVERIQLTSGKLPPSVFYAQLRRSPNCCRTGTGPALTELTVELKDPTSPVVFDNLITVSRPDC